MLTAYIFHTFPVFIYFSNLIYRPPFLLRHSGSQCSKTERDI